MHERLTKSAFICSNLYFPRWQAGRFVSAHNLTSLLLTDRQLLPQPSWQRSLFVFNEIQNIINHTRSFTEAFSRLQRDRVRGSSFFLHVLFPLPDFILMLSIMWPTTIFSLFSGCIMSGVIQYDTVMQMYARSEQITWCRDLDFSPDSK